MNAEADQAAGAGVPGRKALAREAIRWQQLLRAYDIAGQPEKFAGVMERMKAAGCPPTEDNITDLMFAYRKAVQPEKVEGVVQRMKAAGCPPTERTFTELMRAYMDAGQLEKLDGVMQRMKAADCPPTERTFTEVMCAYIVAGQLEKVEGVMERMKAAGCPPTEDTFTDLMFAYMDAGQPQKVESVVERMKAAGCPLTENTFTVLLHAYIMAGQQEKVEGVMERMKAAGYPSWLALRALICGYIWAGQPEKAGGVVEWMKADGYQPAEVTAMVLETFLRVLRMPGISFHLAVLSEEEIRPLFEKLMETRGVEGVFEVLSIQPKRTRLDLENHCETISEQLVDERQDPISSPYAVQLSAEAIYQEAIPYAEECRQNGKRPNKVALARRLHCTDRNIRYYSEKLVSTGKTLKKESEALGFSTGGPSMGSHRPGQCQF